MQGPFLLDLGFTCPLQQYDMNGLWKGCTYVTVDVKTKHKSVRLLWPLMAPTAYFSYITAVKIHQFVCSKALKAMAIITIIAELLS